MKQFNSIQRALLTALSDGVSHSGNALGQQLGVSRTSVWKHIKQLTDLGVPITSRPKQGYYLKTPTTFLSEEAIHNVLTHRGINAPLAIHCFASLPSTNRFLKDSPPSNLIQICCTEHQTEGRGRFNRTWHSPFADNLYFSIRWHLDCDLSQLSGLSLVVSLAIVQVLKSLKIDHHLRVKWPNDVLWEDKKLSGVLIEIQGETNGCTDVIIGIGLNVNSKKSEQPDLDKPWCSLHDVTGQYYDRNLLIANLILQLDDYLKCFLAQGLSPFQKQWKQRDYLKDRSLAISQPSGTLHGVARGINESGQLIVMDEYKTTHYLSSGDTSLRPNT